MGGGTCCMVTDMSCHVTRRGWEGGDLGSGDGLSHDGNMDQPPPESIVLEEQNTAVESPTPNAGEGTGRRIARIHAVPYPCETVGCRLEAEVCLLVGLAP